MRYYEVKVCDKKGKLKYLLWVRKNYLGRVIKEGQYDDWQNGVTDCKLIESNKLPAAQENKKICYLGQYVVLKDGTEGPIVSLIRHAVDNSLSFGIMITVKGYDCLRDNGEYMETLPREIVSSIDNNDLEYIAKEV